METPISGGEDAEAGSGSEASVVEPGIELKLNLKCEEREVVEGAVARFQTLFCQGKERRMGIGCGGESCSAEKIYIVHGNVKSHGESNRVGFDVFQETFN